MKRVIYQNQNQQLWIWEHWLANEQVHDWLDRIAWQQNNIKVFGKNYLEPRLTAWFGPQYQYANVRWPLTPWTDSMLALRQQVEAECKAELNAVLCNLYRSGSDAMGWHADNEPEIDPSCIASLSLGATRTFRIKHRKDDLCFDIDLHHGSLLVMEHMQKDWVHAVPRRLKITEPRINFTFRKIDIGKLKPSQG